jgi:hypothetical protein
MNIEALITMVIILALVWGGLFLCIIRAVNQENKHRETSDQ